MNWELQLGRSCVFCSWSYGRVLEEADLYSQKIFGPAKDLACECGKYSGDRNVDIICDACGVKVAKDAAHLRRVRLGYVALAGPCLHPMGKGAHLVEEFPIAPIAYRTTDDGVPNALGRKYEALIRANLAAKRQLPDRDSEDFYPAWKDFDRSPLEGALRSVVGEPDHVPGSVIPSPDEADCVLARLFMALAGLDPGTPALIRAMGCMIRMEGVM